MLEMTGELFLHLRAVLNPALWALNREMAQSIDEMDLNGCSGTDSSAGNGTDVKRFLNRLLGLPLRRQNCLFRYFTRILDVLTANAKADGSYDAGVSDVSASSIRSVDGSGSGGGNQNAVGDDRDATA